MEVQRTSIYSGETHTMEINVSEHQLQEIESPDGRLIQNICPHLDDDEREFLLTGTTPDEWDEMFGDVGWSDDPLMEDMELEGLGLRLEDTF